MDKNELTLFKSVDVNPIHGNTIIDHRIRHKLKLNFDEYVVIDLIHKLMITNKSFNYERLRNYIGIDLLKDPDKINYNYFSGIMKSLKEKKLYDKKKDKNGIIQFVVTKKYQIIHRIELDDNYELFWEKSDTHSWTGSKKAGKALYKRIIAKYGHVYINKQKENYFTFLSLKGNEWRHIMSITTFLNFEKERYNEAWGEYILNHKEPNSIDKPETENTITSMEDVEHKFE